MAESQHSLLSEADFETTRPQRTWNPLGRNSPELEYAFLPTYREERQSFSEEVLREVGLGITNTSGETLPRGKRDSISSETSPVTTPGFLKTPQGIPTTPHQHHGNCPSRATVLQRRFSWVPVTIFVLAFYATVFSGIYLAVAIRKPRWSNVGVGGSLAASTANLLCAFFAKTIELAYVTICVAFLGQVLSRRALTQDSRGVSISDMSMRAWIMQPGSMLVHWETLRYSALSFLGLIALIATFVAMLYTTAAEALVSPKLSMGPLESTIIWGKVYASWGNPNFLAEKCQTPIPLSMDPQARNSTCLQMEHVGQAYHNFEQWMTMWTGLVAGDNKTSDQLQSRPKPTASMWDNTTVTGSWIDISNMTELSLRHGRMVNNITMALPHAGVPAAVMDPKNDIRQPQEASGEGKYNVEASVPSPAVNVLCVGMNESELAPLVYSSWPDAHFNATGYSVFPPSNIPRWPSWLNSTVVDDIFGFGEKYGQRPPIFGTFPTANNTILNTTGIWPTDAIYLIGKPSIANPEYVMCSVRGKETGVCSTRYEAASSGALLASHCEDKSNILQHNHNNPSFVEGLWSADWKNVATEWASALSLGSGITASQASTERIIMQMMPTYSSTSNTYTYNPRLPSVAEALAVMAGSLLILSTQDAPFVQGWNYTAPPDILPIPEYQHFLATLQSVDYASGGTEKWQGVFYVILIFAFLTSAVCLVFMIVEARGHQITDFTEPQNLFALAVNSPQSSRLQGACGGGPVGRQLKERWVIGMEEMDAHYYIRSKAEAGGSPERYGGREDTSYRGVEQMDVDDGSLKAVSPAVDEFRKVSKRRSWLARFY
ncbi:hypothetical protein N7448_006096 [Penicillium atrosanguineum]|uniref:Uncharacterized protein n=1 Tax=Penicillium atrosanguineum TaxID=1132637 RepID=A0A9W9GXS7_9EURO|nr:FAD-binding domain-containing protein [Penicillium atrosanguineum]KAJ5131938.1 hypothetical protein N7448_006096 [Penicillium atrosanguineum]KAJ5137853.1 hypothetical protein N7526_004086 [Penicillium atrosanguineum]KAJ5289604.1 FAD-binding domain-containing protein [Penicillium atrosanguineum]KAJ5307423.1 hypothetical protein N7476_008079 [Penicillium atrosanguineum]